MKERDKAFRLVARLRFHKPDPEPFKTPDSGSDRWGDWPVSDSRWRMTPHQLRKYEERQANY